MGSRSSVEISGVTIVRCILLRAVLVSVLVVIGHLLTAMLSLLRRCLLRVSMRAWSSRGTSRRMSSTCGWSRRPGSPGLGGAGARPPAGLIWSPAVLGLAVGLGDPRSYCRGVAACWLDAEFCRPRAYGAGLGSCGVAVGAGCDPSCA